MRQGLGQCHVLAVLGKFGPQPANRIVKIQQPLILQAGNDHSGNWFGGRIDGHQSFARPALGLGAVHMAANQIDDDFAF